MRKGFVSRELERGCVYGLAACVVVAVVLTLVAWADFSGAGDAGEGFTERSLLRYPLVNHAALPPVFAAMYRWFNYVEGIAWIMLGVAVLVRMWQQRITVIEALYGLTFVLFGLTDFWEAHAYPAGLLLAKAFLLALLLLCRSVTLRTIRPHSRWF